METYVEKGSINETRNGFLRAYTKELAHYTAGIIHQIFPDLTPNELSTLGFAEVVLGAYFGEEGNINFSAKDQVTGFGLQLLGNIKDGLDGPLARIIMAEDPYKHDSFTGQLVDVSFDKGGEIATAWLRIRTAYLKNNPAGEYAGEGAAMTATLPALTRAGAESLGFAVPENGKNLLEAVGTRFGRIVLGMAATHVPFAFDYLEESEFGQKHESIAKLSRFASNASQPAIDTLATAANLYTASARLGILLDPNSKTILSETQRKEAITRFKVLLGIELISITGTIAIHELLREIYPRADTLGKSMFPDLLK